MEATQEIIDRIAYLQAELTKYGMAYYVKDQPLVDDATYDALYRELEELEASYPQYQTEDSPTARVGGHHLTRL